MEKAKLNLMIAYAADSLFYMFLKTQVGARSALNCPPRGALRFSLRSRYSISLPSSPLPPAASKCSWLATGTLIQCPLQGAATEEHPVTEELARIKTYMGKLKQLGEGAAKDQQRLKVRCSHWPRAATRPGMPPPARAPAPTPAPAAPSPMPSLACTRSHAQSCAKKQVNKEAAQRFIAAGLGGGGGGDGDEREGKKEKREKPDLEDSGKKKKKKST
jgi:hypothetical protein